ncbi:hypothetical protein DFH06DRAFT_1023575 [Mycena polygramma]|nr:hypothetical protein DFH06DRAFT_1023575 [Mycena polygramma]
MWADGARDGLLRPHIEPYADALERGWRAERDYLQNVCNEYHTCISWRLSDHEEPEVPLPIYDPLAPPTFEQLSDEEADAKHKRVNDLNKRIRRWLKYRARSLRRGFATKASLHDNPFSVLLAKLSGLTAPPKARQGFQQYMHESYDADISSLVAERWAKASINPDGSANTKSPDAPFRCAIARELFKTLPEEQQQAIRDRAVEEAKERKRLYAKGMKDGPSKSPEARQKCIDKLGRFVAPIIKGLQEYTGLQGFLVMGGPIPRYGGELGTIHLSVGSNLATVPTPFPSWDKGRWARDVVGFFKDYLATAYTKAAAEALEIRRAGDRERQSNIERNKRILEELNLKQAASLEAMGIKSRKPAASKKTNVKRVATASGPRRRSTRLGTTGGGGDGDEADNEDERGNGADDDDEGDNHLGTTDVDMDGDSSAQRLNAQGSDTNMPPIPDASTAPPPPPATLNAQGSDTDMPPIPDASTAPPPPPSTLDAQGSDTDMPPIPDASTAPPPPPSTLNAQGSDTDMPPIPDARTTPPPPPSTLNAQGSDTDMPPRPKPKPAYKGAVGSGALATAGSPTLGGPTLGNPALEVSQSATAATSTLVTAWVELERSYAFAFGTAALKATHRPAEVKKWIGDARGKTLAVVPITNMGKFVESWWKWWTVLQPSWRGSARGQREGPPAAAPDADWSQLVVPGQNGLLTVMATLYWWGCAEKGTGMAERSQGWEEAARDVLSVLNGLRHRSK